VEDCKYCGSDDVDLYYDDGVPICRCENCGESWERVLISGLSFTGEV